MTTVEYLPQDKPHFERMGVWRFEICRYDPAPDCLSIPLAVIELEGMYLECKGKVDAVMLSLIGQFIDGEQVEIYVKRKCWCGIGSA